MALSCIPKKLAQSTCVILLYTFSVVNIIQVFSCLLLPVSGIMQASKFRAVGNLLENFFWSEYFHLKIKKLGLKTLILRELRGKVEFFSICKLFCQKLVAFFCHSIRNLLCLLENCNFLLSLLFLTYIVAAAILYHFALTN